MFQPFLRFDGHRHGVNLADSNCEIPETIDTAPALEPLKPLEPLDPYRARAWAARDQAFSPDPTSRHARSAACCPDLVLYSWVAGCARL